MSRQLVFVHGRSQEHKDATALKAEWLDVLAEGLAKNGLTLPIVESDVRFPYYGDTLYDIVDGKSADEAAAVIVRGEAGRVQALTAVLTQNKVPWLRFLLQIYPGSLYGTVEMRGLDSPFARETLRDVQRGSTRVVGQYGTRLDMDSERRCKRNDHAPAGLSRNQAHLAAIKVDIVPG